MSHKKKQPSQSNGQSDSVVKCQDQVFPLHRVSNQLVDKLKQENIPKLILPECYSLRDKVEKYYQQYAFLFEENQNLNDQLVGVIERRNLLADKFNTLKRTRTPDEAIKRKRRYARDIERLFHCPIQKCNRGYGSEGSLSHHVRLKHLEFYQSGGYQLFIQKFIDKMQEQKKKEDEINEEENLTKKVKLQEGQKEGIKKGEKKLKGVINVKKQDI